MTDAGPIAAPGLSLPGAALITTQAHPLVDGCPSVRGFGTAFE